MHVCVSRVLFPNLVKTLKSESILSLFAEMWVAFFFFIFLVILFSPWALVLPSGVHRGTVDGLGESSCDLRTLIVRFSP